MEFQAYTIDQVLQQKMLLRSKNVLKHLLYSAVGIGLTFAILYILNVIGKANLFLWLATPFYVYAISVFIFGFVRGMVPPKCTNCGKRMKKYYEKRKWGREGIIFYCKECKMYIDSDIEVGD